MQIHLYAMCWNEQEMIPFFLRHYEDVVDRIFICDDGSDDRSVALLRAHPKVELIERNAGANGAGSDSVALRPFYNQVWKRSRGVADWIITCNLDELYFHRAGLREHLAACMQRGENIVPAFGFEMSSWRYPAPGSNLAVEYRRGIRSWPMNKVFAFNPDQVREINFGRGRHLCLPEGNLRFSKAVEVQLLHYHYVGFLQYVARYFAKKKRNPVDYHRSLPFVIGRFLFMAAVVGKIPDEH